MNVDKVTAPTHPHPPYKNNKQQKQQRRRLTALTSQLPFDVVTRTRSFGPGRNTQFFMTSKQNMYITKNARTYLTVLSRRRGDRRWGGGGGGPEEGGEGRFLHFASDVITCTLKWTGSNRVQITCNTSSAYRVQHALRATRCEGTAQLLSLTEFTSRLFELYYIG